MEAAVALGLPAQEIHILEAASKDRPCVLISQTTPGTIPDIYKLDAQYLEGCQDRVTSIRQPCSPTLHVSNRYEQASAFADLILAAEEEEGLL